MIGTHYLSYQFNKKIKLIQNFNDIYLRHYCIKIMFKLNGYKHTRDSVLEQIDNIKYKCQLPPIAHYKYLNNLQEVSPKKVRTRAISESGEQSQKIVSPS